MGVGTVNPAYYHFKQWIDHTDGGKGGVEPWLGMLDKIYDEEVSNPGSWSGLGNFSYMERPDGKKEPVEFESSEELLEFVTWAYQYIEEILYDEKHELFDRF